MSRMDDAAIREAMARAEKATPGQWKEEHPSDYDGFDEKTQRDAPAFNIHGPFTLDCGDFFACNEADASFIAAARTDVPALAAEALARGTEVEGLRAEVERLTRQRDEAHAVLADAAAAFSAGDMERVRLDLCDRYARTRAATLNRQRAEEVARLRAALDALAKATEFPDHSEGHTGPENCAGCRIEAAVDVARAAIAAKGGAT